MFVVMVGGLIYEIIRGSILEEQYGKPNLLAKTNLYDAFMVGLLFLVAPAIGSFQRSQAGKVHRASRNKIHRVAILGPLLPILFSSRCD